MLVPHQVFPDNGFQPFEQSIQLKLPARAAQSLKEISGSIEVFDPSRDADATVNLTGFVGREIADFHIDSLSRNGIGLSVLSKAGFDHISGGPPLVFQANLTSEGKALASEQISVIYNDVNRRIVKVSLCDARGQEIPAAQTEFGVFKQNGADREFMKFNFDQVLPKTAILRLLVATPKSVAATPFTIRNIPLP